VLNALLYVAEHGCKCRGLPKRFGRWHTIYTRMNRWSKNGFRRIFSRFEKLDVLLLGFLNFALIIEALR
jgi:transposase